ncbi:MAG: cell division protein FtsW [Actinomycetota bacterium]|jgi:cell division protein FtsW|nr:cell division protein FtsW [Actinomycetota bacterium]
MPERGAARAKKQPARKVREPARAVRRPLRLVTPVPVNTPARDPARAVRTSLLFLLIPSVILIAVGVVEVLSASSVEAYTTYGTSFWFFGRQVMYVGIGSGALLVTWRLPYRAWQRAAVPFLGVTVFLMLLALHPAAGTSAYGASRWIAVGPFTLQPSEFAKLGLVAFAAMILTKKWDKLHDPGHLALPLGLVVLVVAGIVLLQHDLGTTVVLCSSVFVMVFVAGARMKHLALTAVAAGVVGGFTVLGTAYRRARFLSFLDPGLDPQGTGYQLTQGLISLGSGGWFGVGLGASRGKWQFVPNAHTDFIFAILGEELGFLGELVVLTCFVLLIYAGVRIALRAPDVFGRLLATGITAWIGVQAVVNLGAVTGLLPITGVPLPLVSFGGSALIVTMAAIGVLANIARSSVASGSGSAARAGARTRTATR